MTFLIPIKDESKEFHNEIFILENRRISRFSRFLDCL